MSVIFLIVTAVAGCGSTSDTTVAADGSSTTTTGSTVETTTTIGTTSTTSSSTTTTTATTTTSSSTTTSTVMATTTTASPTTTPDDPPGVVTGVTAGTGGGSGEVSVTWDHNTEPDLAHYNAYFSELPGGPYAFLRQVPSGDSAQTPGRAGFIDFDRDLTVGKTCYRIAAVDAGGNEGARSAETCFDA